MADSNQEFAEQQALELACEDWTGVWEALWILNSLLPNVPFESRIRLAAEALRRLNHAGHITFIRVPWPGPSGATHYEALLSNEVETELQRDGWKQVPPDCDVWFGATAAGQAVYTARDPASFG